MDLWYKINADFPNYKLRLVPFEDNREGILSEIKKSGEKFDFLIGVNDFIRNDLEKNHPQIRIEDTPQFYDLSVFNRCAESGNVLLTIECWRDVHPGLVSIPVNWEYSIPYGLLYSINPDKDVLRLVEKAKPTVRN